MKYKIQDLQLPQKSKLQNYNQIDKPVKWENKANKIMTSVIWGDTAQWQDYFLISK